MESKAPDDVDPQRRIVLYSAEELEEDPTAVLSFWKSALRRYCFRINSLVIDTQRFISDHTLSGVYPTSFELALPNLLRNEVIHSARELESPLPVHETYPHWLSRFVWSEAKDLSKGIVLLEALEMMQRDIINYTKSVPEMLRVHSIGWICEQNYEQSTLREYLISSAREDSCSALLLFLKWSDVQVLLHYMQRRGSLAFSEDHSIVKFIAPSNLDMAKAEGVLGKAMQYLIWNQPKLQVVTVEDTWLLKLNKSIAALRKRVKHLEGKMAEYRQEALHYKVRKDVYMAKLMLSKLMHTRKQRDASAAGLVKLELLEQNVDEWETQRMLVASFEEAAKAMRRARVITREETAMVDGEEVVVGTSTRELTVEDVEEAMAAFDEEVQLSNDISKQLAGDALLEDEDEIAALEAQLESLEVTESKAEEANNESIQFPQVPNTPLLSKSSHEKPPEELNKHHANLA